MNLYKRPNQCYFDLDFKEAEQKIRKNLGAGDGIYQN